MSKRVTRLLFPAVVLLIIVGGCAENPQVDAPSPGPSSSSTPPTAVDGTLYGFFPFPGGDEFEDVVAHFEDLALHGDVVLVQPGVPWEDFAADQPDQDSPARTNIRNLALLTGQNGLQTVYVMDPLNGLDRRQFLGLPPGWEPKFTNPDIRASMTNLALWIVREFRPRYLGIASEINTYIDEHPEDADGFLTLYREIYEAVKAESPGTQVFVTFQWDALKLTSPIAWEQIESFEPELDLWVISSYPFVVFPSGAAIPDDYYTPLLTRTDKPLAVAEGGYVSRQMASFPGSPQDQTDYLAALDAQLGGRLDFWIYLLLNDFDPQGIGDAMRDQGRSETDISTFGLFSSVGLREADGTPKPAMATWDAIRAAR